MPHVKKDSVQVADFPEDAGRNYFSEILDHPWVSAFVAVLVVVLAVWMFMSYQGQALLTPLSEEERAEFLAQEVNSVLETGEAPEERAENLLLVKEKREGSNEPRASQDEKERILRDMMSQFE